MIALLALLALSLAINESAVQQRTATQIKGVGEDAIMWPGHWVTDHSAVEFKDRKGVSIVQLHDYSLGTVTPLPRLSELFDQTGGEGYYNALVSPDGLWLMWVGMVKNKMAREPVYVSQTFAARLDGSHFKEWKADNGPIGKWMSDSRHWIRFVEAPVRRVGKRIIVPFDRPIADAWIGDTEHPDQLVKMKIPPASMLSGNGADIWINALKSPDRVILCDAAPHIVPSFTVETPENGRLQLFEFKLDDPAKPVWKRTLQFPSAERLFNVAFADSGDRVAWVTTTPYDSKGSTVTFWKADLPNGEPVKLETFEADGKGSYPAIMYLRWLPGGKRLAFEYKRKLYRIQVADR